jgi:hypothetical protein
MSYTRNAYDACAYNTSLSQSVAPLSYILDDVKYRHCKKCRMEMGIVGGTAVSHHVGEMQLVDLENDLRGQTRPLTRCQQFHYQPSTDGSIPRGVEYIKPVEHPALEGPARHLPACQLAATLEVPEEPKLSKFSCASVTRW